MRALTLATIYAAASGYLVLGIIAPRALGAEAFDGFAAYWALFFALTGVAGGLMQETTRAVRSARGASGADRRAATPRGFLLRAGALVGGALALLVALSAPAWSQLGLNPHHGAAVAILAVGIAGFAMQAAVSGALSGTERWNLYAVLLAVDATLRLLAAGAAWHTGVPHLAFELTTVIGAATWLFLLAHPQVRAAMGSAIDVDARRFWRHTVQAMGASAGTSLLITGFPLLVTATARDSDPAALLGATLLAISLTRAPLLVPLTSFQSALIVWFVERREQGPRALLVPLAAVTGIGIVGAVAAWAVASPIVRIMTGDPDFALPGLVFGLLTAASVGTAALMISGNCALALERHGVYSAGWWIACAAAVGLLLALPYTVDIRAAWALFAGPLLGVVFHIAGIAWRPAPGGSFPQTHPNRHP